jgi:ribosomal protein L11 methyltransferase
VTDRPLAEVRVQLAPCNHEIVFALMGGAAPDGFTYEEREDGGLDLILYSDIASAESALLGLVNRLEQHRLAIEGTAMNPVAGDWMDAWKQFHTAVTIGRLWVGQPWQEPEAGKVPIVIDPGQGFGTGAHPTTHLVLALLQPQERCSVLDVGCGSGVLAIAAAKLGFSPVIAIDNDPAAVESARANVERNGERRIVTKVADALATELPAADLVLANITLNPLQQLAPRLRCKRAILSGLLRSQAEAATDTYAAAGFVVREQRERDGWIALHVENIHPV